MNKSNRSLLTEKIISFLDSLEGKATPKRTLQDHVLIALNPPEYREFRSIMRGCQKRVTPGGSHEHLLGTVVFPSPYSTGRPPKWCANVAALPDKVGLDAKGHLDPSRWFQAPVVSKTLHDMAMLGMDVMHFRDTRMLSIAMGASKTSQAAFGIISDLLENVATLKAENDVLRGENAVLEGKLQQDIDAAMARYMLTHQPRADEGRAAQ
jgi:hypothetical protein